MAKRQPAEPEPQTIAKVMLLRVSVGTDDTRTMQEFLAESKAALYEAGAKNVSSMGEQYIVDGQTVSVDDYERPSEPEPEPEPSPDPESGNEEDDTDGE